MTDSGKLIPEIARTPRIREAIEQSEGILRLAPNWIPRALLTPGRRLRLHPEDYYALGAHRGGIDERWFSSTIEADNEGRAPDEGLSYVVHGDARFTLREAIASEGSRLLGRTMWDAFGRWSVFAKYFDNKCPIPMHLHQDDEQARVSGQEGKPESYYFPPQLNPTHHDFPYTFFGLEPGTSRGDLRRCLERWNRGDNGVLGLSKAYRLEPGTGWLVPPRVLHAPGSLLTFEPQWASDVFAMFQSTCDGRCVPWNMLVKDVPNGKKTDLDFLVELLDWNLNTDTHFKEHAFLRPLEVAGSDSEGWVDRWIVYGRIGGRQLFSARELTLAPGTRTTIRDDGAYGLIAVQGTGRIGPHALHAPSLIRFGTMTEDEVFVSHEAATRGVTFENHGREPLVTLRYFGPDAWPAERFPDVGAA